jgi:methionyl-tRNA synthetase
VYDNGHIYKGNFEGWFCPGCEEFKSDKVYEESGGLCPNHKRPLVRRSEPCWYFRLSSFKDRLLAHLKGNPGFVEPESRRNEMIGFIESEGLKDLNISRHGEQWGIRLPFDPEFTIYVWFDALLTYITGIGYGDDETTFRKNWPCDTHFIGKDITRFHTHIWPAMLWAAGEEAPKKVFSHGFVYRKNETTGDVEKIGKALGNVVEPMEVISKFSADAFRYYFLRECPYSSDGEFSWGRFAEVYNSELANNLGNTLSRCITLVAKNYNGTLAGTGERIPEEIIGIPGSKEGAFSEAIDYGAIPPKTINRQSIIEELRTSVEECKFNLALQTIVLQLLTPTNQYLEANAPWKLVKTDREMTKRVLHNAIESLRIAAILLKPFIPRSAETIYTSFNFPKPWSEVTFADAAQLTAQTDDLRVTAELVDGKVKPLFPRIG